MKKKIITTTDNTYKNPSFFSYEYSEDLQEKCLIEAYFRANPKEKSVMISCPCPKCSTWC